MQSTETPKRTSPVLIAAAWAVVIVPGAWGLRYTVANALKIFARSDTASTAPVTPPGH